MAMIVGEMVATATGTNEIVKRGSIWTEGRRRRKSFYVLGTLAETEDDAAAAIGVPPIGTSYQGAVCRSHQARELATVQNPFTGQPGILWEIECGFDNEIDPDELEEQQSTPPEQRRPKVNWDGELEDEVLERDADDGTAITTAAGEQLPLVAPYPIPILEVTRYEIWPFEPLTILLYAGSCNEVEFYGAPTGTAWLEKIVAPEAEVEGALYVLATYRIKFKMKFDSDNPGQFLSDTWKAKLLNQGHQYLNEAGDLVRATDKSGNPVKVNLDEDGTRLPDGSTDFTYRQFNRFRKTDLNDLNLGPFN